MVGSSLSFAIARMICSIGVIPERERQANDVRMQSSKRKSKWAYERKYVQIHLPPARNHGWILRTSPTCNHPHVLHCLNNWFSFLFRPNSKRAWKENMENIKTHRITVPVIPSQCVQLIDSVSALSPCFPSVKQEQETDKGKDATN